MKKLRHITHGELNFFEVTGIPKGAKRIYPSKEQIASGGFILAASETTGNHHCVEVADHVEFYEHEGTIFVKNTAEAKLFCVDETRHDTVLMPKTVWKRKIKKEVDHVLKIKRNTAD